MSDLEARPQLAFFASPARVGAQCVLISSMGALLGLWMVQGTGSIRTAALGSGATSAGEVRTLYRLNFSTAETHIGTQLLPGTPLDIPLLRSDETSDSEEVVPPVAPEPLPAEMEASPAAFVPRPHGPVRSQPPTDRIARIAWEAERKGIARYVGVWVQADTDAGKALIHYRGEEDFPAASVIKVPVMMAVQERWAQNGEKRDARHVSWLSRMIRQSDNHATNALVDVLGAPAPGKDQWRHTPGMDRINSLIRRVIGTPEPTTRLRSKLMPPKPGPVPTNRAAPHEFARLLREISRRERAGEPGAREMLTLLRTTSQDHRTRIPRGIPAAFEKRVGNKTGTLSTVVNDAAIVETPSGQRYLMCLFMEGVRNRARAEAVCRRISAACWNDLSGPGFTKAIRHRVPEAGARSEGMADDPSCPELAALPPVP